VQFANGKLHFVTTLYFANGTTHFEVRYQRGVLDRTLSRWNDASQLVKQREFDGDTCMDKNISKAIFRTAIN